MNYHWNHLIWKADWVNIALANCPMGAWPMFMKKTYSKYVDSIAFVNYLPWESSHDNKINNIEEPCSDLWRRVFIWYDGKINPCDYDYKSKLSKHNIKDFTIDEVWNSSYYNSLREKHLQKKRNLIFPCNRCNNI